MKRRRKRYGSDTSKAEWKVIKPLLPKFGANLQLNPRRIVDAIFYVNRTGVQWRELPSDYPNWSSIFYHYDKWRSNGVFEALNEAMVKMERERVGRKAKPTGGVMDSQSVKTTAEATEVGYDGGKKIKGHKRHIITDTCGNLLKVVVSAAGLSDNEGGKKIIDKVKSAFPTLKKIWADGNYKGQFIIYVQEELGAILEQVKRAAGQKGFQVLPRRWVVERTFAWIDRSRRLSKDYERLPQSSEAMVYLASIRLLLRRVAA
jgi:putative transposase